MGRITQRTIDELVTQVVPKVEELTGYTIGQPGPESYTVRLIGRADYFSQVFVKEVDNCGASYKNMGVIKKLKYQFFSYLFSFVAGGQYIPSSKTLFLVRENLEKQKKDIAGIVAHELIHHGQFTHYKWAAPYLNEVRRKIRESTSTNNSRRVKKYRNDLNEFMTLIEGEAVYFQSNFKKSNSASKLDAASLLSSIVLLSLYPSAMIEKGKQYVVGERMIGAAFKSGGIEAIDGLYRSLHQKVVFDREYQSLALPNQESMGMRRDVNRISTPFGQATNTVTGCEGADMFYEQALRDCLNRDYNGALFSLMMTQRTLTDGHFTVRNHQQLVDLANNLGFRFKEGVGCFKDYEAAKRAFNIALSLDKSNVEARYHLREITGRERSIYY